MGGRVFDFPPYRVSVRDSGSYLVRANDLPWSAAGEQLCVLLSGPTTDLNLPPEVAGPDGLVFGDCFDRMPKLSDPQVAAHLKRFIAWQEWNLRTLHADARQRWAGLQRQSLVIRGEPFRIGQRVRLMYSAKGRREDGECFGEFTLCGANGNPHDPAVQLSGGVQADGAGGVRLSPLPLWERWIEPLNDQVD